MSKLWIPCLVAGLIAAVAAGAQAPAPRYLVGVVSEAGDIVTWLAPGAGGILTLDRVVKVDPGAVDVLDLLSLTITSSFPVSAQPTGVTILRLE